MQFFLQKLRKDQRKLELYQENSKKNLVFRRNSSKNGEKLPSLAEIHAEISELQQKNKRKMRHSLKFRKNTEISRKLTVFQGKLAKNPQNMEFLEEEDPLPRKPVKKYQETAGKVEEEANFKGNSRESTNYSEKAEVLKRNSAKNACFSEETADFPYKFEKFRAFVEKLPAWLRDSSDKDFEKLEELLRESLRARENLLEIQLELLELR